MIREGSHVCGSYLHILYNGTTYGQISLFQHFSSYYVQVYIVLITGQVDKQWGKLTLCQSNAFQNLIGERGGSVVECRTPEREVGGSRPTAAVLCP